MNPVLQGIGGAGVLSHGCNVYFLSNLTSVILASSNEKRMPTQLRGPVPNGINAQGCLLAHRSLVNLIENQFGKIGELKNQSTNKKQIIETEREQRRIRKQDKSRKIRKNTKVRKTTKPRMNIFHWLKHLQNY